MMSAAFSLSRAYSRVRADKHAAVETIVRVTVVRHLHTFIFGSVLKHFWRGPEGACQMRGQIEIITEILKLCLLPRTQTTIRGKTSLNHQQMKAYMGLLETRGLLERNSGKYTTTQRGGSFLEAATQLSLTLENSRVLAKGF